MEYNAIGSLTSMRRSLTNDHMLIGRARSSSIRRGSYSVGSIKPPRASTSASKVDILKSTIEVNSRSSTPQLKNSGTFLNKQGNSTNKVSHIFLLK